MSSKRKQSRYIPKRVRDDVRKRDKDICQICRNTSEYMEFDHITPFSLGAPATVETIQQLCRKCNLKKRNKTNRECSKCGGWNAHDAQFCHHCGASQPLQIAKIRNSKNHQETAFFEDLLDPEILFWLAKKLVGISLILLAVYMVLKAIRH